MNCMGYLVPIKYGAQGVPVPADAPSFFPSWDVPIAATPLEQILKIGLSTSEVDCARKRDEDVEERVNVAFEVLTRADYVVYRYNSWVQACQAGGGNQLLPEIISKIRRCVSESP
jgi:hypothetical protein